MTRRETCSHPVKDGSYPNSTVENTVFLLKTLAQRVKPGGFVTADGTCPLVLMLTKSRISVGGEKYLQYVERDAFIKQEGTKEDIVASAEPQVYSKTGCRAYARNRHTF